MGIFEFIYNNAESNKLEDQVFWYKASPHPDFKIGVEEFWKAHNNNFRPNGSGEQSPEDENEEIVNSSRKRGPLINFKNSF